MTKPNWAEQFDKEIYPHLLDIIDSITHGNYPPEIMHQRGDGWIDKDLKEFISNLLIQERKAGYMESLDDNKLPDRIETRIRTETIKEVKTIFTYLVADEASIAMKEGQPTSRLTSLHNKFIKELEKL